jgi:hypothetical protein
LDRTDAPRSPGDDRGFAAEASAELCAQRVERGIHRVVLKVEAVTGRPLALKAVAGLR